MSDLAPCGTTGAYQRHLRRGETPDEACRHAMAAYHRNRRASNPEANAREAAYRKAYNWALSQLARENPARFTQLVNLYRGDTTTEQAARRAVLGRQGA